MLHAVKITEDYAMKTSHHITLLYTTILCTLVALPAQAANFTITNGQTVNTTQTIGAGANEVGTVNAGGTIAVTGDGVYGIDSTSAGGIITNRGTVTTGGNNAFAIRSQATNTSMTNNGEITTSGLQSNGIFSTSNLNTLSNTGRITISGQTAGGLYANGNDSTLTNSGTITTTGIQGYGIYSTGSGNTLTNSGTISTDQTDAYGMTSAGANSSMTNSGSITANGNGAHGIFVSAANNTATNSGRITVTGTNANALRSADSDVTITNAGYARSVASDTVRLEGTNNTLVLKANSTVDGTVVFTGGGTRTLTYDIGNTGRSGSITRITSTLTGAPTQSITNTPSGMSAVQSGNTLAVVSPDQFGGASQVISQTVGDVGTVVNTRQQMVLLGETTDINSGVQYAASGSSMNDADDSKSWGVRDRKVYWAEAIGSYLERGQTSDTSETEAKSGGVLTGVDLPQTSEGLRSGFYAGGFGGALNVGTFKDVESIGGMAGGYVGKSYGEYYVSGQLGLGFSNNDVDRFTGVDSATSDYTSYFVSPAITMMRLVQRDGYTLVPNMTLRYTAQFDDGYSEKGSAVNQSVDSTISHLLNARAMVEARIKGKTLSNGNTLKTAFRAGLEGETQLGGNTDVRVLGSNLSFDPSGYDNTLDAILGVNLNLTRSERIDLYFDAEGNLGLSQGGPSESKGAVIRLGAKWKL